jgi:hypothetical protein
LPSETRRERDALAPRRVCSPRCEQLPPAVDLTPPLFYGILAPSCKTLKKSKQSTTTAWKHIQYAPCGAGWRLCFFLLHACPPHRLWQQNTLASPLNSGCRRLQVSHGASFKGTPVARTTVGIATHSTWCAPTVPALAPRCAPLPMGSSSSGRRAAGPSFCVTKATSIPCTPICNALRIRRLGGS